MKAKDQIILKKSSIIKLISILSVCLPIILSTNERINIANIWAIVYVFLLAIILFYRWGKYFPLRVRNKIPINIKVSYACLIGKLFCLIFILYMCFILDVKQQIPQFILLLFKTVSIIITIVWALEVAYRNNITKLNAGTVFINAGVIGSICCINKITGYIIDVGTIKSKFIISSFPIIFSFVLTSLCIWVITNVNNSIKNKKTLG